MTLSDIFQIFPFKCTTAINYLSIVGKISISNAIMASFLERAKIKIFSCNSIFSLVKVTRLLFQRPKIDQLKIITSNDQTFQTKLWHFNFSIFPSIYFLLRANWEHYCLLANKVCTKTYFFFAPLLESF